MNSNHQQISCETEHLETKNKNMMTEEKDDDDTGEHS
jgi:hypothetical protein